MNNLHFISPELFVSLSIMFLLILGVFKKNSSNLIHNLSTIFLILTGVLILNNPIDTSVTLFRNSLIIDNLSSYMKVLTIFGGVFALMMSTKYFNPASDDFN